MSEFVDYVYNRTIDYIQNSGERGSDIRYEYARYMSERNWNNNEMANLIDIIAPYADSQLANSRSEREDEQIVNKCVQYIVDAHCGYVAMGNKRLVDSVDDTTYSNLKRAAQLWEDIMAELNGRGRGRGGAPSRSRQMPAGGGRRSVFDNSPGVGGRRSSVFDSAQPSQQDRPATSNGSFGGGVIPPTRSSVFETTDQHERGHAFGDRFGERGQEVREELPRREMVVERKPEVPDGPDMSKARPYDSFMMKGENWQLAHCSTLTWASSVRQPTRRAYNPDNEMRFLVKGTDGTVREEFVAMTADLEEEAHRIRTTQRPNRPREALAMEQGDSLMVGQDIDAVDLDAMDNSYRCVRRDYLGEIDANNPVIDGAPKAINNFEEGALAAIAAGAKTEVDVASVNTYEGISLVADQPTMKAVETMAALTGQPDFDLRAFAKHLNSMRGIVAENVLDYIDRHFTQEVNDTLRDQFGFTGLTIDSYMDDFEALLGCKKFVNLGAGYVNQFLQRTRMLTTSLQYLSGKEERTEYLECGDLLTQSEQDTEQYTRLRENVLVIFKLRSFVHVKIDMDAFGMVSSEMRVATRTGEGSDPTMADLLRNLYAIGRKTSGAGRVYMVSADNLVAELVPASGARDVIGIRSV